MKKKRPEASSGSASDWISHAESDLALAKLAATDQSILASQVCFHCQQAAEKSFKAVLRNKEIIFPLTHDLDVLIDLLEQNRVIVPPAAQKAGQLTPYAVEARYPGSSGSAEGDIQSSIALAEIIVNWAAKNIV